MRKEHSLLSRAQGCLLGQLAGDSLGSLVEFQSSDEIAQRYPTGPDTLVDGGAWNLLAGQPTDDGELALTLARNIIGKGAYDEESVATGYARWLQSNPFDVGNATRTALSGALAACEAGWSAATGAREAALTDTQANGALMRVSPIGIFGAGLHEDQVFELASIDAGLTHPHEACRQASGLFAAAIAFAIRSGETPSRVYDYTAKLAEAKSVNRLLFHCFYQAKQVPPSDFSRNQGWVLTAFQNAFHRLLHANSLREGVIETVRAGGDTDTNAAIAGALLGAVYGLEGVPQQWQDSVLCCRPGLRPQQYWPGDALHLAEELVLCAQTI